MLLANEDSAYFDTCRQALLEEHTGKFAVVCGRRLLGIHNSLDLAMKAAAEAWNDGELSDGAPILINEIGEAPRVRVVAERDYSVR